MFSENFGQIITFYSYKGGTGRTMAVANTACLLATIIHKDSKILMIDWDLGAPGLYHYFREGLSEANRSFNHGKRLLEEHAGLIDLFIEIRNIFHQSNQKEIEEKQVRGVFKRLNLEDFILKTKIENLYLMNSGKFDNMYSSKVTQFNWHTFFERSPSFFTIFTEILSSKYEYVLIDSRTGVTDVSGICTTLMPNKLVTVFTPNKQNLDGILDLSRKATEYRLQSDDLRPLSIFPLPSRVESSESELKKIWRFGSKKKQTIGYQPAFEDLFESIYQIQGCDLNNYFNEVQIQHYPKYSYGEEIAVLSEGEFDRLSLNRSYQAFTDVLLKHDMAWDYKRLNNLPQNPKFDVFMCYDQADRRPVIEIAKQLRAYGLTPWLDVWELKSGMNFQMQVRQLTNKISSMALFIGKGYVDRGINSKTESILQDFFQNNCSIIPVLLSNIDRKVNLPRYLEGFEKVDFNLNEPDPTTQLIRRITGQQPDDMLSFSDSLSSSKGVDYRKLQELLMARKWRDADYETYIRMLEVIGHGKNEPFRNEQWISFPCSDLQTIDHLWVKYSQGKFGFSVQKKILVEECGASLSGKYPGKQIWHEFCERIGWRVNGQTLSYTDMTFDTSAPHGHLPGVRLGQGLLGQGGVGSAWCLLFRLKVCST